MNKPLQHRRIGVVVIGQSPRPDVAAEIAAVLSSGVTIELRGAQKLKNLHTDAPRLLAGFLLISLSLAVYFTPTLVAFGRDHYNRGAIFGEALCYRAPDAARRTRYDRDLVFQ